MSLLIAQQESKRSLRILYQRSVIAVYSFELLGFVIAVYSHKYRFTVFAVQSYNVYTGEWSKIKCQDVYYYRRSYYKFFYLESKFIVAS